MTLLIRTHYGSVLVIFACLFLLGGILSVIGNVFNVIFADYYFATILWTSI